MAVAILLHRKSFRIARVTIAGAASINAFECEFPRTAQGQVLCFFLAFCAIALGGYLTATLGTFFVSQDAESDRAEIAATQSLQAVETKITALRRFKPV
ncbi:hypothetical protein [Microcoleus sp. Pol14C2]|uniref:hypothetical protein n=1 Tax=Microcoleus sp. Pol14C2 TaxID=3055397 RepID=UPI002FD75E74